jgi:hypothetical protein
MKRLVVILGMVAAMVGFTALSAQAFTLMFDENGKATVITATGTSSESGVMSTSPDGFTALSYALPNVVKTGYAGIADPQGGISDLLVFGTQTMWYYSAPGPDLADLSSTNWAIALADYPNAFIGATEAADGTFSYSPSPLSQNIYDGTSSSTVPEPSTILLLVVGLSALAAFKTKSRRA